MHDNLYIFPEHQRVKITKHEDSYHEFPQHKVLAKLDISDRNFVAASNKRLDKRVKRVILQATYSKWRGKLLMAMRCQRWLQPYLQKKTTLLSGLATLLGRMV